MHWYTWLLNHDFNPCLAEPLSMWQAHVHVKKNFRKILWFELVTVTSQSLKHNIISYTPMKL